MPPSSPPVAEEGDSTKPGRHMAGRAATVGQLEHIGAMAAAMIQPGQIVGLGSGRAAHAFVRMLGRRRAETKMSLTAVATSQATEELAHAVGIPLTPLETLAYVDIAVDGADEVDPQLNLLKGGGGALLREKVIESLARRLVIVVGQEKLVDRLGTYFPVFVEVVGFAMPVVTRTLTGWGATVTPRRQADGALYKTDNGNPLLHVRFEPRSQPDQPGLDDLPALERRLHSLPGVIETGLFLDFADEVLVANFDGTVEHRRREAGRKTTEAPRV